ncbi:MAG: hypothetical protein R3Y64_09610 [Peptostreptococcaceae bacterium]
MYKVIYYHSNYQLIENIDTLVYIKSNEDILESVQVKESFDYKEQEKYIPFNKRAINIDLKKSYENIEVFTINNGLKESTSIHIDYSEDSKPSIVEVFIQLDKDDIYYWDYFIEVDDFLDFILPKNILEKNGLYHIQVNIV